MATALAIANAAVAAGVTETNRVADAVAVALAATGGNERAVSGTKRGLWLIPDGTGGVSGDALFDIDANARAMAAMSSGGTNWAPWPVYKGARFILMYPIALTAATTAAAGKAAVTTAVAPVTSVVDAAADAVDVALAAGAWAGNRNNWIRVGKVVAGLLLVAGGAFALARPMDALNTITKPIKGIL